jgi:hypothetical protein
LYDTELTSNEEEDEYKMDKGINSYFENNGISSMYAVKNLGSTLVYIAFIIVSYLALILSYILQGFFRIFETPYRFIKK